MKVMKHFQNLLLLLLLLASGSSSLADSHSEQTAATLQADQPGASNGENGAKNGANAVVDKSQNKRGAPAIPVIIGTPAHQQQHTAYINQHVAGATVVAAPISGHATHTAALSAVPFGAYGHHTVAGTGHILQAASVHAAAPQYNYAAVPQLTYTHYPQYQLYHPQQQQQQSTGLTHEYAHPIAATIHEQQLPHHQQQQQQQQQTAYAHQQPIYAHHPATAIHYAVPATLVSGQHNYHGQQQLQQQQQQQQYPLTHTQAIHYQQAAVGGQPSVPIVHQAPIATINQVHQAQQIYAAHGQLSKYPVSGQPLVYGAGGLQQNQIYSTAPSYGDPDTLTNLALPDPTVPSTPRTNRPQSPPSSRPFPGDVRPITEYEDDGESDDGTGNDDLYRDEQQQPATGPTDDDGDRRTDLSFDPEEPCDKDAKRPGGSAFNRNLYNMWRAYGVARTLLHASGAAAAGSGRTPKGKDKPAKGNTDRIQLIHPPGESDKTLKGKYYRGKYYGYSRQSRQDGVLVQEEEEKVEEKEEQKQNRRRPVETNRRSKSVTTATATAPVAPSSEQHSIRRNLD
ncbi:protein tweety-like isoform X1 [Anopheles darlingi]|uniref:protein tweety-like isoform X1 n=1 Tax=Anopheles darlingi TaxID=43151 RepID=UPI0021001C5A|nr:protein tweety-like isoform X1 [Anopheles darlingi]